jgi:FKBP-type peptidyl-prolyl cis-trans isomerase 2
MKKAIIFLFLAIVLITSIFLVQKYPPKQNTNLSGNITYNTKNSVITGTYVLVDYVGYLDDGTVIDTSLEEEAKKAGMFTPLSVYRPMQFQVGSQEVIKGIESAVVGMVVGEEKEIELQPEYAFGEYDNSKIISLPRIRQFDRTLVLDRLVLVSLNNYTALFSGSPVLNQIVDSNEVPWKLKIIKITSDTVFLEHLLQEGQRLILPQTEWESVVEEITESHIFIKQNPQLRQKIKTLIGEEEVIAVNGKIIIKSNPDIGKLINTAFGVGKISDVNETSIILDFNHPYAGKKIKFRLTLVNLSKGPFPEKIEDGATVCPDTVEGNTSAILKIKYFYSPFCPWCIKEEPILEELIQTYGHLFNIDRYDVRYCPEQVSKYQVSGTPAFVFSTENGAKEFVHPGFIERDKLKEIICGITKGCG